MSVKEMKSRHQHPSINYEALEEINRISGLSDTSNRVSTEEAHKLFMENYHRMFIKPPKPTLDPPHHCEDRNGTKSTVKALASVQQSEKTEKKNKKGRLCEEQVKEPEHNIADHLQQIRKEKKEVAAETMTQEGRIKVLRRLLRKRPFQRTAAENKQICRVLQDFPTLATQVDESVLKELSVVACLETESADMTVFGNTGLHIILRGSVLPRSYPHVRSVVESEDRFLTPAADVVYPERKKMLNVGDCFGTLKKIKGIEPNSIVLSVTTLEECEFVKLFTGDYERIHRQIGSRNQSEKIAILTANEEYKGWSQNVLLKVASSIKWLKFPPNTVIVTEGYKAPFIGYVHAGECVVMRQVMARKTLANGKVERRKCQVVVGRLGYGQSFGEVSLLDDEAMSCTVVTETQVELGVIEASNLSLLDNDTRKLLRQCSKRTFGDITEKEIEEEYMRQEAHREWNEFKHGIVMDVINAHGMRPGYGKWSK